MTSFFEGNGHEIRVTVTDSLGLPVISGTVVATLKDRRGNTVGDADGYPLAHVAGGVWVLALEVTPMVAGARYELTITINAPGIATQRIDKVIPCVKRSGE